MAADHDVAGHLSNSNSSEEILRCLCDESWAAALPGVARWGGALCKTASVRALLGGCLVGVAHPRCSAATGDTGRASLTTRARIDVLSHECNLAPAVLCFLAVAPLTANPRTLRGECICSQMAIANSCGCGFPGNNNAGPRRIKEALVIAKGPESKGSGSKQQLVPSPLALKTPCLTLRQASCPSDSQGMHLAEQEPLIVFCLKSQDPSFAPPGKISSVP